MELKSRNLALVYINVFSDGIRVLSFNVGHYIYAEASWPRKKGDVAKLSSPPLTGIWCMRFFYCMYGVGMGDLQVFLHHADDLLESFVWGIYKNQGKGWKQANATVYGFFGRQFNVRPRE